MPRPLTPVHPDWLWVAACASLGLGSAAVWIFELSGILAWHAGTWAHHPWVIWSASLAHLSGAHLVGNLAALGVLAVLGTSLQAGTPATMAWMVSWPVGTAALWWWPELTSYSGLSGLLCAAVGVLCGHALRHPSTRTVGWVLLVTMTVKLLSEQAWTHPIGYDLDWGFNVVYAAHLTGFVIGAACGQVAAWCTSRGRSVDHGGAP